MEMSPVLLETTQESRTPSISFKVSRSIKEETEALAANSIRFSVSVTSPAQVPKATAEYIQATSRVGRS